MKCRVLLVALLFTFLGWILLNVPVVFAACMSRSWTGTQMSCTGTESISGSTKTCNAVLYGPYLNNWGAGGVYRITTTGTGLATNGIVPTMNAGGIHMTADATYGYTLESQTDTSIVYTLNIPAYNSSSYTNLEFTTSKSTNFTVSSVVMTPVSCNDTVAPTCGAWSPAAGSVPIAATSQTFTLSGSTDNASGMLTAGGSCSVNTNGGTCSVVIQDNSGNTTTCVSPAARINAVPTVTLSSPVKQTADNGATSVNLVGGYVKASNKLYVSGSITDPDAQNWTVSYSLSSTTTPSTWTVCRSASSTRMGSSACGATILPT